jgi:peroxiredoxin
MSSLRTIMTGIAVSLAVGAGTAAMRYTAKPSAPPRYITPLGDSLPNLTLKTLDGRETTLKARLNGKPALIYVFGAAECASCSALPLEFQIVHRESPSIQTLLIGSGATAETLRPGIEAMGLASSALVDEDRQFIRAFELDREPFVLLVDSTGHILIVDSRGASRAAQFPMGRILHEMKGVLR